MTPLMTRAEVAYIGYWKNKELKPLPFSELSSVEKEAWSNAAEAVLEDYFKEESDCALGSNEAQNN